MIQFYTLGAYHLDSEGFFYRIKQNNIDAFLDIRERRVVKWPKFSFANSRHLQASLKEMNVHYEYIKELAPTKSIREAQMFEDQLNRKRAKNRQVLGDVFKQKYREEVLAHFDLKQLAERLEHEGYRRVLLFSAESVPLACHRSLVSSELEKLNYSITHLL